MLSEAFIWQEVNNAFIIFLFLCSQKLKPKEDLGNQFWQNLYPKFKREYFLKILQLLWIIIVFNSSKQ